jgi:Uma2 family endonuclease
MAQQTLAPWAEIVPGIDHPLTDEEILALPDDEWQYEVVAGRLVRMPLTGWEHRDLTVRLFRAVDRHVEDHQLGEVSLPDSGFRLNRPGEENLTLAPDVAFVGNDRLRFVPKPGDPERRKFPLVAPDLAVEVASPDQYRPEMAAKALLYLAHDVRLVWIAWGRYRQVDVWHPGIDRPVATLGIGDVLDGEDVLPGFKYPLARLFL